MNAGERQRYYVRAHGPDEQAMRRAFQWLLDLVARAEAGTPALLVVPTKANLRGIITSVVGKDVAKLLAAGQPVRLTPKYELRLATKRTLPAYWEGGPVLAAYPTKQLLDMLDDIPGISHILVVPSNLQEVEYWIDTWMAPEIDTPSHPRQRGAVQNPVVVEALKTLTDFINVSTGISNPSDRQAAVDLFRRLKEAGEDFNPSEVRAWLVRDGRWGSRDADDVKSIAERVLSGRRFRGGVGLWRDDIVEQWRSQAKND